VIPAAVGARSAPLPGGLRAGRTARRRNWPLLAGIAGGGLFLLSALLAPVLAPHGPVTVNVLATLHSPGGGFPLGTDNYGRDVLSRTLYGGRVSLLVSCAAVAIGLAGGLLAGLVAGLKAHSVVDSVTMRCMDLLFSFPAVLLAIVIMARLGASLTNAMIAIGIIFIPGFARLARALTIRAGAEQFIDYSRATGTPAATILLRGILPNIYGPLLAQATVALGYAVTLEATLSFLGLGAQPPTPSWGNMIAEGRTYMTQAPWIVLAPLVAVCITIISLNLLGEGLRVMFDRPSQDGGSSS
jgi:peptide/nickel transport system permease protein